MTHDLRNRINGSGLIAPVDYAASVRSAPVVEPEPVETDYESEVVEPDLVETVEPRFTSSSIEERLLRFEKEIAEFRTVHVSRRGVSGPQGPRGVAGPAGPRGPIGPQGDSIAGP